MSLYDELRETASLASKENTEKYKIHEIKPIHVFEGEDMKYIGVQSNTEVPIENKPTKRSRKKSKMSETITTNTPIVDLQLTEKIEPTVPIQFFGTFGSFDTYYFDVTVQANALILIWDIRCKFGKYTPPEVMFGSQGGTISDPIGVRVGDIAYQVYNYNLKFNIPNTNYEVLILLIKDKESLK